MKITVIGKTQREYTNEKTGVITTYVNIYGTQDFNDYERKNGCVGRKSVTVNTTAATAGVNGIGIGDDVNVIYEPSGFKDKNGKDQFRISEILVVAKAADKAKAVK